MQSGPSPAGSRPRVVVTADLEGVARAAADGVRAAARAASQRGDRFRLALAGGSTPRALYRLLAAERGAVDWTRTDVFFGDERAVPPDHPESNYRMARETLLEPAAVPEASVRRMRGEAPDLDGAARDYEAALTAGAAAPAWLDLVLLGMGADGHTASLFPGTAALGEERRLCVAVEAPGVAPRRLTLTFPVLLEAREVLFLVAGSEKAEALREALAGPDAGPARPARHVMWRRGPVALICDRAAAALLPPTAAGAT